MANKSITAVPMRNVLSYTFPCKHFLNVPDMHVNFFYSYQLHPTFEDYL